MILQHSGKKFSARRAGRHCGRWITGMLSLATALVFSVASFAKEPVAAKRECATCHIMWLSEFKNEENITLIPYDPKPVLSTGRQDIVSSEGICFSCHDGFMLDSRFLWESSHYAHPVGVVPSDKIQIPTSEGKTIFPLNDDGKLYCGSCHSAHGVSWESDEQVKGAVIFMRVPNIDSSLCEACHGNKSQGPEEGSHPVHKVLESIPGALRKAEAKFSENNEVICQTCHSAHRAKAKKLLVVPNRNSSLCTTCHSDRNTDSVQMALNQGTHPVNVLPDKVKIPEAFVKHGATLGSEGKIVCQTCHRPHDAKGQHLLVLSNRSSELCGQCHGDKYATTKSEAARFGTHPVNVRSDLVRISSDLKNDGAKSGPNGEIICQTCHRPHGAQPKEHLLIWSNHNSSLCQACHQQQRSVLGTKHDLQSLENPVLNIKGQNPVDGGPCSACHLPHGGNGPKMWARELNPGTEIMAATCLSCHNDGEPAEKYQIGKYSHPVDAELSALPGEVKLSGFLDDGTKTGNKQGKVTCPSCHDPHQWQPKPAAGKIGLSKMAEGDGNSSFLRLPAGPEGTLCIACHSDKGTILGTDHDLTVTAPDEKDSQGKGVAETGLCGACHAVHNARNEAQLWRREFGPGQDKMEKECTSCHRDHGIASDKIPPNRTHPPRIVTTNYDDHLGNSPTPQPPLFNAEQQRTQVGMISCPTCHNPHKWNPANGHAGSGKNLEGNVLTSFLRDRETPHKLCADCHGPDGLYRYQYYHWDQSRPGKNR